ncbi:long-chain fatty acid--CoA ligase [Kordiimonas sp. SCSIO 12610]|uniref:long-chain-fatty-acid--CoA ligase n=1 Tax=Kordiimonas sp. SCSIO 12610 TaxID=2829597 RepID=UPI00210AD73E|nr:long-chain fatty acid--CoA ligase [Kordiimonas sp. SCSIO 12610]UTW56781.1 long-chain fatty acid--CoA ligase [Kordiimonas sp. SCSIO 12610]
MDDKNTMSDATETVVDDALIYQSSTFSDEDMLAIHVSGLVDNSVNEYGDKPAFSCALPTGHSATISFNDLGKYSDAIAVYLREELGLKKGDVVAIQCLNTLAYPILAFGILKAGLIVTNLNPLYTAEESQHQLKDSGAKILFLIDVFGDRAAEATEGTGVEKIYKLSLLDLFPAVQKSLLGFAMKYIKKSVPNFALKPDGTFQDVLNAGLKLLNAGHSVAGYLDDVDVHDPAIFQYTGGTTGRSKGAELTHNNVVANVSQGTKVNDGAYEKGEETMMLLLPLYHVYALAVGALASMYSGVHIVLVPVPRPLSNLKIVFDKFDISILPGINTLYLGLLQEEWFTSNPPKTLQFCYSGAAPLQPATMEAWEKLVNTKIYEGYGLTEGTCAVATMPLGEKRRPASVGLPLPGVKIRTVMDGKDVPKGKNGEIWIQGPQVMKGYLNRPEATAETIENGWLKTGDIGYVDDDGYLYIVDRMKDMVIVSGFNVYPTDIEDVLSRMDGVAEATVVGVPSAATGEKVVAYVVKAADGLNEKAVIDYCKEHLTNYKCPKIVKFVDELPKSPVGKVLRRELRDIAHKEIDHA